MIPLRRSLRWSLTLLAIFSLILAYGAGAAVADPENRFHFNENRKFYEPHLKNMRQVGHYEKAALSSDVWAHGDFAYIGSWNSPPSHETHVVDVTDPKKPTLASMLFPPEFTRTNDIKVTSLSTAFFEGDLALVSNEPRGGDGACGIQLWDVTDGYSPTELSSFDTGCRGVHNIWIDGTFAYLAGAEDDISGRILWIVDIENPFEPELAAKWWPDVQLDPAEGQRVSLHDMTIQDGIAYLAYWDAGLILLDVSDPFSPTELGRTTYWPAEEGNTHAVYPNADGSLAVVGDEIFGCPSGFLRVFDTSDPTEPVQIGTLEPEIVVTCPPQREVDLTIHNIWIVGDLVFASWYALGVRVIDISDPFNPVEVGHFVTHAAVDPLEIIPTAAEDWGVYVDDRGLIYYSDMMTGLWILELSGQLKGRI